MCERYPTLVGHESHKHVAALRSILCIRFATYMFFDAFCEQYKGHVCILETAYRECSFFFFAQIAIVHFWLPILATQHAT